VGTFGLNAGVACSLRDLRGTGLALVLTVLLNTVNTAFPNETQMRLVSAVLCRNPHILCGDLNR